MWLCGHRRVGYAFNYYVRRGFTAAMPTGLTRHRWCCPFQAAGKPKLPVAVLLIGTNTSCRGFCLISGVRTKCSSGSARDHRYCRPPVRERGDLWTGQCRERSRRGQGRLEKGLADLGVSASENTSSSSYEGVVQQELPTALRDVRECKLRVFQTLQEKLSPDARSTPVRTRSRRHKNWIAAATPTTSSPLQYSMYSPRCERKTLPSTRTNGVIA